MLPICWIASAKLNQSRDRAPFEHYLRNHFQPSKLQLASDALQSLLGGTVGVRHGDGGAIFFSGGAMVALFLKHFPEHDMGLERRGFFDRRGEIAVQ